MMLIILLLIHQIYCLDKLQQFLQLSQHQLTQLSITQLTSYFQSGEIQGYFSPDQTAQIMEKLSTTYSKYFSSYKIIGQSTQGRSIHSINFQISPEANTKILFMGMLHGTHDLISPNYFLFQINYLLQQILQSDIFTTRLLDQLSLELLPMLNIDAASFILQEFMETGSMPLIHKNRRSQIQNYERTCSKYEIGVDLQRNFPYQYSYNNVGSSNQQCDIYYRGTSVLSEYESQALDYFVQKLKPQLMIIVTGDSPGIVIPDYLFSFTEIDHYQVLLAEIAEKYGLKVGTNKEIMKKEVNGDICNSFMAHMGILCFRVNIGQNLTGLAKYQDLILDILKKFGPLMQMKLVSQKSCTNEDLICEELTSFQQGYITTVAVSNQGLIKFESELKIDIQLQQNGQILYKVQEAYLKPDNQTLKINSIDTNLFRLNLNQTIGYNESITIEFLVIKLNRTTDQLTDVKIVNIQFELKNAYTVNNSFILLEIEQSQFTEPEEVMGDKPLFRNRVESFIILIILSCISVILFFIWISRKLYLMI